MVTYTKRLNPILLAATLFFAGCQSGTPSENKPDSTRVRPAADSPQTAQATVNRGEPASTATILQRRQVPILCYHQVRDWTASDSKTAKDYIVPLKTFEAHMKMLADSGYKTILPDQLMDYLLYGAPLPEKPVMLTFDDTDDDQFVVAKPLLDKYGFKGVFFLMTVTINRPHYMTREQIRQLADEGHEIAAHTWDHHMVTKYDSTDWKIQLEKPKKTIEDITGKPVKYFAYPFGLWNEAAIPPLKKYGIKAAFQLATRRSDTEPLYTIRRIIASGYWDEKRLNTAMKNSF